VCKLIVISATKNLLFLWTIGRGATGLIFALSKKVLFTANPLTGLLVAGTKEG
jgi:hypothetical protein